METESNKLLIVKYYAFEREANAQLKTLLRFEIFNILRQIEEPLSDELHIWGLTYYMSNDDKEYHTELALEKFVAAYELDATHFLACLYTAHCYHDQKKLLNALKYYNLVDKNALREFQLWRYVKLIEQIGYCYYQLGEETRGRVFFEEVLQWYKESNEDDVLAVPQEMLECLPPDDILVIEIKKYEDYL